MEEGAAYFSHVKVSGTRNPSLWNKLQNWLQTGSVNWTGSAPKSGDLKGKIQHEQKQELCPHSWALWSCCCLWGGWGCGTGQCGIKTKVSYLEKLLSGIMWRKRVTFVASRVKQVRGWVIPHCWKWLNGTISTSPIKRGSIFFISLIQRTMMALSGWKHCWECKGCSAEGNVLAVLPAC